MKKQLYVLVALLVAATMVLTACGAAAIDPGPRSRDPGTCRDPGPPTPAAPRPPPLPARS